MMLKYVIDPRFARSYPVIKLDLTYYVAIEKYL